MKTTAIALILLRPKEHPGNTITDDTGDEVFSPEYVPAIAAPTIGFAKDAFDKNKDNPAFLDMFNITDPIYTFVDFYEPEE